MSRGSRWGENGLNELVEVLGSRRRPIRATSQNGTATGSAANARRNWVAGGDRIMKENLRAAKGCGSGWSGATNQSVDARNQAVTRGGDSQDAKGKLFRQWGQACCPLIQVPVAVEQAAARVASRTKRATLRAQVRRSARMEALAALAWPNQGERFTPRRAWAALRLSA